MLAPRHVFLPAVYRSKTSFASLPRFMSFVGPRIDSAAGARESLLTAIEGFCDELAAAGGPSVDQAAACKRLLAVDLRSIGRTLEHLEVHDPARDLEKDMEALAERATAEGLRLPPVHVRAVDTFPAPFATMQWTYFNADRNDESKYGIAPGIYVKISALVPDYTSYVLAHELVHVAVGHADPVGMARGLEDGLADLFGSLFLFAKVRGRELAENLLVYDRFAVPTSPIWEVYLDSLRAAGLLYRCYGLDGLRELICAGRPAVRRAEAEIYAGRARRLGLARGGWDDDVDSLTDLLFTYPRNHVVSPLAKYASKGLTAGVTVRDAMSALHVEEAAGRSAIEELQAVVFAIVVRDGVVVSSELPTVCESLRYTVDPENR